METMTTITRIALVTGAGSGMGEAVSHRLAREGMAVAALDINGEAAARVVQDIHEAGGEAVAVVADVGDRDQVEAALDEIHDVFGPVTVLVNNAGVENFTPFDEIDGDNWRCILDVNLTGSYVVTQAVLPDMLEESWGRIVNIASLAAQVGAPNMVHYAASKGGVVAMTRSLAIELGPRGITVNAVSPGFIDTPMSRRSIDNGAFGVPLEQMLQTYPIPRLGRPEEVATACAFFISEDAGYITGQLLGVNGGTAM